MARPIQRVHESSIQRALERMRREVPHPHHWAAVQDAAGHPHRIHVVPVGDLRDHVACASCWCWPERDDEQPIVWSHRAMDGREAFEQGQRAPS